MKFITLLGLLSFGFLSSVSAQALHALHEGCLLSNEPSAMHLNESSVASRGASRTTRCSWWECYAGEGTEESPYIITVGAYIPEIALQTFSARDIDVLMKKGVDNFNQGLINSGIKTAKITFEQLIVIPEEIYDFSAGELGNDVFGWSNCSDCIKDWKAHGNDLTVVFHESPENISLMGLASIGGSISGVNLSSGYALELVIPHEIGHLFGAGHHLGTTTSGGLYTYSNAVVCEDEEGNRASSLVSAWEISSRVLQFSSPDMDCGTSETDNARTILEMAQRKGSYVDIPQSLGEVRFEVSTNSITEGESFEITVVRDGDISSVGFVGLWVEGDALQKGTDYIYIKFEEGEDTVNVTVETIHDNQWSESSKALAIQLEYPTGLSTGDTVHVVEVLNIDDRESGYIDFDSIYLLIKKGGQDVITLNRLEGVDGSITVNLVMENTSEAGKYLTLSAETVIFEDGETVKTIDIVTLDDDVYEGHLTFNLTLTGDFVGDNPALSIVIESNLEDNIVTENDSESSGGGIGFVTLLFGLFLSVKRLKS